MSKQTTTKGFATLTVAGVLNKFLALAYVPIQTAIVGDIGNGVIAQGYKIYVFIYALSTAGIPVAISKLISEQESLGNYKGAKKILKVSSVFILSISIFLGLFMAFSSKFLSSMLGQEDARLMLIVLSPALLFTAISSVFRGYFQGKLNMIPTAISQVLEQLLNSILTIVFIAMFIKYGIDKAAAGYSLATTIAAIGAASFLVFLYIRNRKKEKELINSQENSKDISYKSIIKRIMTYVLPAILGIVAINANDLIDLMLVKRMMAGGFTNENATTLYGIFTAKYQRIINLPLSIGASLATAMVPAISAADAVKDYFQLKRKSTEGFKVIGIMMIPAAVGLSILARPVISLVFFDMNPGGEDIMRAGSWVVIFMSFVYVEAGILNGINKPHIQPINLLIGMGIKFLCVYFLASIPAINVKASIIGTISGFFIAILLNYYFVRKYAEIKINFIKLLYKPVISSLFMGVIVYFSFDLLNNTLKTLINQDILRNDVSLIITVIVGVISYLFMMSITKGINSNDILKLPMGRKINRFMIKFKFLKES
jgi:stage V sporulation protein B